MGLIAKYPKFGLSPILPFRAKHIILTHPIHYPFGMGMQGRSFSIQGRYRYGFNGKENDSEGLGGGSCTYDYGFRIYNSSVCKFLSVDPLSNSYPWNSTYCFAENQVINAIDLEGLEKLVVILEQNPAKKEFDPNANFLIENGYEKITAVSALDMQNKIIAYSKEHPEVEITNLVILSHGSGGGLFGLDGDGINGSDDNGLYTDQYMNDLLTSNQNNFVDKDKEYYKKQGALTTSQFSKGLEESGVKFAKDAQLLLGGCNTGSNVYTGLDGDNNLAQSLTLNLKIRVIAGTGYTWDGGTEYVSDEDKNGPTFTRKMRYTMGNWMCYSIDPTNKEKTIGCTIDAESSYVDNYGNSFQSINLNQTYE